ncbi:MAG TPA: zinc ribbon domain-containing protein [Methanoregulaceae archaeon]|nr:zinc ribbon domain-containing protein [Methanoregulaceae archaeon]
MDMVEYGLKRGERLIRETPDIVIKENQFTLFLTDRRLIFGHVNRKNNFDIDFKDLADIEFYETEAGEPLFVVSVRGRKTKGVAEIKKIIMVFSGQSGDPRSDEAEIMFSYIHAIARKNQKMSDEGVHRKKQTYDDLLPGKHQCSVCGNEYREGTPFCTYCGAKITPPIKKEQNKFALFSFKKPEPDVTKGTVIIKQEPEPEPVIEVPSSVMVPCRICMELIPDNSVFCKYCGARQAEQKETDKKRGFSLSRFFSAGKK